MPSKKEKLSQILTETRHSHLCGVQIPAVPSLFPAIKKVKSVEKEFDTVFGLYCQICYTNAEGNRYYTSGASDEMTLSALNAYGEKNGWKKGIYR